MATSLHVSLPDELRRFVGKMTDGSNIYSTPSEYVRDLIRKDMQEKERIYVYQSIVQSIDEAEKKDFVSDNFMDDIITKYTNT